MVTIHQQSKLVAVYIFVLVNSLMVSSRNVSVTRFILQSNLISVEGAAASDIRYKTRLLRFLPACYLLLTCAPHEL
jgi:hypothetical protein